MKTISKNILVIFLSLYTFTACEDKLELNDPNNVGDAIALINDKNVKTTLIGAYDGLSFGSLFGGNTFRNSELLAANGEVIFSGTFNDVSDIFRKEMITTNADATAKWNNAYRAINIANNVLSALDVVDQEDKDQIEGEALFLRGVLYFELIKFFAQPYAAGNPANNTGVPIMLVDDRNSTDFKARASVQEVYTRIVSDLTTAEGKLAQGPNPGKASREAAAAFLSRVYLQMGNYEAARDAAHRVITSNIYSLRPTYAGCFNTGTTTEDIFDIPVSTADGINNMHTFYASTSFAGRGDIEVQASHLALYEPTDARLALFYTDPGTGDTRVGKWTNMFSNVKVIRLAEMYLTRAECNQRLGSSIGATPLADINTVRARVNLSPLGAVSLNDILNERKLELAHEGQHLHDVKRLQSVIIEGTTVYNFDDPKLVFPIPQREINVNPLLIQNQGYGN